MNIKIDEVTYIIALRENSYGSLHISLEVPAHKKFGIEFSTSEEGWFECINSEMETMDSEDGFVTPLKEEFTEDRWGDTVVVLSKVVRSKEVGAGVYIIAHEVDVQAFGGTSDKEIGAAKAKGNSHQNKKS